MLATQLKLLKEKRGLTNQQLADLSGVPVGTVNRILSGQTDNPSFQTICDLVLAMDGSLDELAGIEKAPEGPEAKAHGIDTIGVTWGYGQRESMQQAGAVALADTPEALHALLTRRFQSLA